MPLTRHVGRCFTSGDVVRDIVIGMSDGLTVPVALAAGLSGAVESTSIVITGGRAEIAAGSIAMFRGGISPRGATPNPPRANGGARNWKSAIFPMLEPGRSADALASYGVSAEASAPVVRGLQQQPQAWIDVMMRFELRLGGLGAATAFASARAIS